MKKLKQEAEVKQQKKTSVWFVAIILLFIFAASLRIIVANQLVAVSDKLAKLDRRTNELMALNEDYGRVLSRIESSNNLKLQAQALGFAPVEKSLIYIQKTNLAAVLP